MAEFCLVCLNVSLVISADAADCETVVKAAQDKTGTLRVMLHSVQSFASIHIYIMNID